MIGTDDERLFVKFAAALQDGSSTQGAFGVFPHDLRRRVSIDGAVEDARLPVDPVLVVGLHYEARRHWRKSKQESREDQNIFFYCLHTRIFSILQNIITSATFLQTFNGFMIKIISERGISL